MVLKNLSKKSKPNIPLKEGERISEGTFISSSASGEIKIISLKDQVIEVNEEFTKQAVLFPGLKLKINGETFIVEDGVEAKFQFFKLFSDLAPSKKIKNLKFLPKALSLHFIRGARAPKSIKVHFFPYGLTKEGIFSFSEIKVDKIELIKDDVTNKISIKKKTNLPLYINSTLISATTEVNKNDLVEFGDFAFYIES